MHKIHYYKPNKDADRRCKRKGEVTPHHRRIPQLRTGEIEPKTERNDAFVDEDRKKDPDLGLRRGLK